MKKRKSKRQIYRWISLWAVVFYFVFIPLSNDYANLKLAYNNAHLVELADGKMKAILYQTLDALYELSEDPVRAASFNNGSLWAYSIVGVPVSDPLGLLSELVNGVKFPYKYVLGGIIPFGLAFLFGRFFCAWLCPIALISKLNFKLRKFLDLLHLPMINIQIHQSTRVFVFWFGFVFANLFGAWIWHFILPYIAFTQEIFSLIVFSTFSVGIYYLLAIILLDIAVMPNQFCKSVCPTGLLLSWIGKVQLFRLNTDYTTCPESCHLCFDACPVDLFAKNSDFYSCHLCVKCIDACPEDNIKFGLNPIYIDSKTKEVKLNV